MVPLFSQLETSPSSSPLAGFGMLWVTPSLGTNMLAFACLTIRHLNTWEPKYVLRNSSKLAVAIGSGYCFHSTRASFPTSTWILKPKDHGSSPCSVTIFGEWVKISWVSNKWPSDFSLGCLDELAGAAASASVEGAESETASGGTFFSDFLSPHGKSCTTNQLPTGVNS